MTTGMTAQEIIEASEDGEPVLWNAKYVRRMVREHSQSWRELVAALGERETYSAAEILRWLGY